MKRHQLIALAAIVLVACVDGGRSNGPSFAISDAVHGGGTAGFYFLPPMVPSPTISEQFNAFLQPLVRICPLDDAHNVKCGTAPIEFTRATGQGSETIRVSTLDKQYVVNWHTDQFNVQPGEQYRIQVFADPDEQFPLGFADVAIAATGKEAKNLTTMETIGLVDGRTLPIKFFAGLGALGQCDPSGPTCAEAIVPPAGGLVVAVNADGEAEAFADFPSDWTDKPTTIKIERIDDRPFETPFTGPLGAPRGVRQWPLFYDFTTNREGLRFAKRVRIGVCNIEDPFTDPFHPEDRSHVSLGIGGSPNDFRTLPFAPVEDILGLCDGVTRMTTASLPQRAWQGLVARAAALATSVLLPQPLYARAIAVVDGGMGGSTDGFSSPVGTVDLAPAPDLFIPTGTPTVTPSTVAPGGTVQLSTWTIKNRGNIDANSPTGLISNGFYLSTDRVITPSDVRLTGNSNTNDVLQVGEQFDWGGPALTIPENTAPGDYYIGILVDETNQVAEFDESNNYVSVAITVTAASPVIDGILSPGEWDRASQTPFTVNVPGGTAQGTLFVMNDNQNLYLAVRFARDVVDGTNLLGFEFDNNNNASGPEDGDEYFNFTPATGFSDAFRSTCGDLPAGCVTDDRTDGAGAFHNDGAFSVYELSHALNSGETGKDFALIAPTRIGMLLQLAVGAAQTRFPAGPFPTYMTISITAPPTP